MPPTFDIPAFRVNFPEFIDTVKYPNSLIEFWYTFASSMVNFCRWGNSYTMGVSLYVAHEITMAALNAKTAAVQGTPGVNGGIANTKTVGGATIGYDTQSSVEKDGGYWNLTNYGKQFLRLARIYGAGVVQL